MLAVLSDLVMLLSSLATGYGCWLRFQGNCFWATLVTATPAAENGDDLPAMFDDMAFCVERLEATYAEVVTGADNVACCGRTSDAVVVLRVETLAPTFDCVTLGAVVSDDCGEVTLEDVALELVHREATFDVVTFCDCCVVPAADGMASEVNRRVVTLDDVTTGVRCRIPYTVPTSVAGVLDDVMTSCNALLVPFTVAGKSRLYDDN